MFMDSENRKVFLRLWLLVSGIAFILPLWLAPCASIHCTDATDAMFLAMLILSFPSSLIFIVLLVFAGPSPLTSYEPGLYLLLWAGFFMTGYLQWCMVAPRFFGRRQMITLGISERAKTVAQQNASTPALPPVQTTKPTESIRPEPQPEPAQRIVKPAATATTTKHFDERGRTPLERVLSRDDEESS